MIFPLEYRLLNVLVSKALGGTPSEAKVESDETIECETWLKLMEQSFDQGVAAIAVDGLALCGSADGISERSYECFNDDRIEDKRIEWYSCSVTSENDFERYKTFLDKLFALWSAEGFKVLLLKGYSLSRLYPNPSHRPFGDIDIYVIPQKGKGPCELDRWLSEVKHRKVFKSKLGHHSKSYLTRDYMLENHYEMSNSYFGGIQSARFEARLQQFALSCDEMEGDILLPSGMLNALFLIWHLGVHFSTEKVSLRQICDWCVFLQTQGRDVDWKQCYGIWEEMSLSVFAFTVCLACRDYLGIALPSELQQVMSENPGTQERAKAYKERFYADILDSDSDKGKGLKRYFTSAWKIRLVKGNKVLKTFIDSALMHLFHKEDLEEKLLFQSPQAKEPQSVAGKSKKS